MLKFINIVLMLFTGLSLIEFVGSLIIGIMVGIVVWYWRGQKLRWRLLDNAYSATPTHKVVKDIQSYSKWLGGIGMLLTFLFLVFIFSTF